MNSRRYAQKLYRKLAAAMIGLALFSFGCQPKLLRRLGSNQMLVSVSASVNLGCSTFTVTAVAQDSTGATLTTFSGPASWSASSGTLSPATPAAFVNGVSTTTGVTLSNSTNNETITISSGSMVGTTTAFTLTDELPLFAGMGYASVGLDGGYTAHWTPTATPCSGFSAVTAYKLFPALYSSGENYNSPYSLGVVDSYSVAGSNAPATPSASTFLVGRSLASAMMDTNTAELPVRTDTLSLATLAGGRETQNADPFGGSIRAAYIDTDSFGNLFFVNGGAGNYINTVGVLCTSQLGVCTGRTLGNTYVIAGSGGYGTNSSTDYSHGMNFSYSWVRGLRLDSYGNVFVTNGLSPNALGQIVTCMSARGVCATTNGNGNGIDASGNGSYGLVGKNYSLGYGGFSSTGELPNHIAIDSRGNEIFSSGDNKLYIRCMSQAGWCANVSGSSIVGTGGGAANKGTVYLLAGGGASYSDGVGALTTTLSNPSGIAVEPSTDNIVFADKGNHVLRVLCKVTSSGICARTSGGAIAAAGSAATAGYIYRLVGSAAQSSGIPTYAAAASSSSLNSPEAVRFDSAGNAVLADTGNYVASVVCNSTAGLCAHVSGSDISTAGGAGTIGNHYRLAGTVGTPPPGIGTDPTAINMGDGASALSAVMNLTDLAVDPYNNVFITARATVDTTRSYRMSLTRVICMSSNGACAKVTAHQITPASGGSATPGNIYLAMGSYSAAITADGGHSTGGTLRSPTHVSTDSAGNFIIAGNDSHKVHVVCTSTSGLCAHTGSGQVLAAGGVAGTINSMYTLAGTGWSVNSGDGTTATNAGLNRPSATAVDSVGNVIIAEYASHVVRVICMTPGSGACPAVTGGNINPAGGAAVAGQIYTLAGTSGSAGYAGDGAAASAAMLAYPNSVTIDSFNNVIVADTGNHRVRIVCLNSSGSYCSNTAAGNVVAAGAGATAGRIYTLAGTGVASYSGDAGTPSSAALNTPVSVAADSNDNIAIADSLNYRVRVICASNNGVCSGRNTGGTLASGTNNTSVRTIYTVMGTGSATIGTANDGVAASSATLSNTSAGSAPWFGVGFDKNGNILVADADNLKVRIICTHTSSGFCSKVNGARIDTSGSPGNSYYVYAAAGNGSAAYGGDGYLASNTSQGKFSYPVHAIGDASGRLLITDRYGNRVRFTFQ